MFPRATPPRPPPAAPSRPQPTPRRPPRTPPRPRAAQSQPPASCVAPISSAYGARWRSRVACQPQTLGPAAGATAGLPAPATRLLAAGPGRLDKRPGGSYSHPRRPYWANGRQRPGATSLRPLLLRRPDLPRPVAEGLREGPGGRGRGTAYCESVTVPCRGPHGRAGPACESAWQADNKAIPISNGGRRPTATTAPGGFFSNPMNPAISTVVNTRKRSRTETRQANGRKAISAATVQMVAPANRGSGAVRNQKTSESIIGAIRQQH